MVGLSLGPGPDGGGQGQKIPQVPNFQTTISKNKEPKTEIWFPVFRQMNSTHVDVARNTGNVFAFFLIVSAPDSSKIKSET